MSDVMTSAQVGLVLAVIASVGLSVALAGGGFVVIDRISMRGKLREIDDLYRLVSTRDQELMLPLVDRVSGPVQGLLAKLGRRFSPADYADRVRIQMLQAGRTAPGAADRFMAVRSLSILAAPLLAFLTWTALASMGGSLRLMATGLVVAACVILPQTRLNRSVLERETLVRKQLPDIMDLLVICMEAGLGFSAAVARTVANVEGEMSDELGQALGEMRAGSSRSDALKNL